MTINVLLMPFFPSFSKLSQRKYKYLSHNSELDYAGYQLNFNADLASRQKKKEKKLFLQLPTVDCLWLEPPISKQMTVVIHSSIYT